MNSILKYLNLVATTIIGIAIIIWSMAIGLPVIVPGVSAMLSVVAAFFAARDFNLL